MTTALVQAQPTVQRAHGWRWLYAFLGAGAVLGMGLLPVGTAPYLFLVVIVGFLVSGLRRPAAIVTAVAVMELTIGTYPPALLGVDISTRYIIVFLAAATTGLLVPLLVRPGWLGPGAVRVLVPAALFAVLAGVATSNGLTPELTTQAVRYYLFGLIATLLVSVLINSESDLKFVGICVLAVLALSGLTAILQHYSHLGVPAPTIRGVLLSEGRSLGLSESAVKAGNDLLIGVLFLWGLIGTLTMDHPQGRPLMVALLVTMLGLYFTYTRSALYSFVAAVGSTIPFVHFRVRKEVVLAGLVLAPAVLVFLVKENSRYVLGVNQDDSAASRIVLWQVGMRIALDYPLLGIGYDAWDLVAPSYAADIDLADNIDDLGVRKTARDFPVHNDFLRVWLSYGTPALLVYVLFLTAMSANFLLARFRAREAWLRGASIGGLAATIGYVANSVFHNYLDMSLSLWLLAGFSVVMLKLADRQRASATREAA